MNPSLAKQKLQVEKRQLVQTPNCHSEAQNQEFEQQDQSKSRKGGRIELSLQIEELGVANKGIPSKGAVEIDIVLQVLVLT